MKQGEWAYCESNKISLLIKFNSALTSGLLKPKSPAKMWLRNNKIKSLFFLFVFFVGLNYLVLHNSVSIFQVENIKAINQLQYVTSSATSPEALNDSSWQAQSLPDDWKQNHKNVEQIWYRAEIVPDEFLQSIWAVYMPLVSHNAEIYINGVWIGQAGAFKQPVSRHHNEPLLFSFSSQLLQPGINQIDIRVATAYHEQGYLAEIYLAPKELLEGAYQIKHFIRVELIKWVTTAMYLMGLIVLVFWLARPQDVIYGLFALQLFFWATHNLNLIITEIPVSARLWEAMTMSTLGWTVLSMVFFIHCFMGESHPRIEKLALVTGIMGSGLFLLPDIGSVLHVGYRIWDGLLIITGLYMTGYLTRMYWHNPKNDYFFILLVALPLLIFGLHDILLVNHLLDRRDGLIIQYSVIPTVLFFSWIMVRRFVQSINQAEALAANLEQRVEENKREIHAQYEQLNKMETQKVLSEERERIMRDMHDGIGGQLVSVIALLQEKKGEIFKQIRAKIQLSLTDLRLVIDSLDPLQNELPTMLGMMRLRLNDQLESAQIKLEWAVTDLPEVAGTSPRQSLHIMRIVQEAITNCIKHADCQKMTLATGVVPEDKVYIDIIDYGKGMDVNDKQVKSQGRGLSNMIYRAKQIGATLSIESSPEGTCIRLLLSQS